MKNLDKLFEKTLRLSNEKLKSIHAESIFKKIYSLVFSGDKSFNGFEPSLKKYLMEAC